MIDWNIFAHSLTVWFRFLFYAGMIVSLIYIAIYELTKGETLKAWVFISLSGIFAIFSATMFFVRVLEYDYIGRHILDFALTPMLAITNILIWRWLIVSERNNVKEIEEKVNNNRVQGEERYV